MANTAAVAAQTQRGKIITLTLTDTQEMTTQKVTVFVCICVCVQEFVATLLNRVFEAGFCSNQASVKYLIEWMMILILVHYPQHMDSFWACFNMASSHSGHLSTRKYCVMSEIVKLLTNFCVFFVQDHEKTKTSVCTFLSVLVHFDIIIPNLKDKVKPFMFFFLHSHNSSCIASRYLQHLSLPVCLRLCSCVKRWTSSCSGVSTTTSACACMPYWP